MGVHSGYINREFLRGRLRFEKEGGSLNVAVYDRVPAATIQQMWVVDEKIPQETADQMKRKIRMIGGPLNGLKFALESRRRSHGYLINNTYQGHPLQIDKSQKLSNRRLIKESVIHFIMRELVKGTVIPVSSPKIPCKLEEMNFTDFAAYLHGKIFSEYGKPFNPAFNNNGVLVPPALLDYALPDTDTITVGA